MANLLISIIAIFSVGTLYMCTVSSKVDNQSFTFNNKMSQEEKDYWFAGKAEVSSYDLSQSRYGISRKGSAVLIFVTEPFSTSKFVKVDKPTNKDITVMKLNTVKKFNTGIYPYSIMTSTFFPFEGKSHALKVSNSIQEWCGHAYFELLNKSKYEITVNSYFEGETMKLDVDKVLLEDELWTMLKINPMDIPTGDLSLLPSAEFLRLLHKQVKAYDANISNKGGLLELKVPELNRKVSINYDVKFPYQILAWSETVTQNNGIELATKATLKKSIMVDYWNKTTEADSTYRNALGLVDY